MSRLLESTSLAVEPHDSYVTLERDNPKGWSNRYLAFSGRRAYHVGYWCDTCKFIFEQLDTGGYASPADMASRMRSGIGVDRLAAEPMAKLVALADRLRSGLKRIDTEVVNLVGQLLPEGRYIVLLLSLTPVLVKLGTKRDYFTNEQTRWKEWASELPHWPKTEYYRTATLPVEQSVELFEFVVPMHYGGDWSTVASYADSLERAEQPTALAISVLDAKAAPSHSADASEEWHYCLAHYLLDGHHKTYAAALIARPMTLLSFLAVDESLVSEEAIGQTLRALDHAEP